MTILAVGPVGQLTVSCASCGGQKVFELPITLLDVCDDMLDHWSRNHDVAVSS